MKNITIQGLENYLVDKNGVVYNSKTSKGRIRCNPKQIKAWANKNTGYMQVCLSNKQTTTKVKCLYVHRLVAATYLPNPLNLPEVNHKDFDKTNNTLENLEWVTPKQNKFHSNIYNKINHTSKVKRIISDNSLLESGLQIWNKSEDAEKLKEIWNCSDTTVYKILSIYNIERNRYGLPNWVRLKIIEDIKNHKSNTFGKIFLKKIISKYKMTITNSQFYKMKRDSIGFKFKKTYTNHA
jgi:hypothetical protein